MMFDPYVKYPLVLSVRLSDEDMRQIQRLIDKLDAAETLNADLKAALELAQPHMPLSIKVKIARLFNRAERPDATDG